jgi:glycine cleavage system aminomethyltransferase T
MADNPSGSSRDLLTSPLHERHTERRAKFAEFGGWSMPLEYTGAVKEHNGVRSAVGVFDVSHLGKAVVRGLGAAAYVNSCLTNDLGKIEPGKAQYTLCCQDDGCVVDDLIAYLRGDDEVFLIPNAANTTEVVRRLAESAPAGSATRRATGTCRSSRWSTTACRSSSAGPVTPASAVMSSSSRTPRRSRSGTP